MDNRIHGVHAHGRRLGVGRWVRVRIPWGPMWDPTSGERGTNTKLSSATAVRRRPSGDVTLPSPRQRSGRLDARPGLGSSRRVRAWPALRRLIRSPGPSDDTLPSRLSSRAIGLPSTACTPGQRWPPLAGPDAWRAPQTVTALRNPWCRAWSHPHHCPGSLVRRVAAR
jgi:hypothetical protein